MVARGTTGLGDGLLAIGLVVGAIGVMSVLIGLAEPAAITGRPGAAHIARPGIAAPSTTLRALPGDDAGLAPLSPERPESQIAAQGDARGQGDSRLFLRYAADLARRDFRWVRSQPEETRTDLRINDPASIGSTSPASASLVTASLTEPDRFQDGSIGSCRGPIQRIAEVGGDLTPYLGCPEFLDSAGCPPRSGC